MEKEKEEVVITDESKIEIALSNLWFEVRGIGGCHAVGGSIMGVMRGQTVKRDALKNTNKVIKNADPATKEKILKRLKRRQYPTAADYADVI